MNLNNNKQNRKDLKMKIAEKVMIVEKCGVQMKYTVRDLILINGPVNPVVMSIIGNIILGLPVAFSTNRRELIFCEEAISNGFMRGHEMGHINLGHLDGVEKGVLMDINKEIAADQYAIVNGYCDLFEAMDCLITIRNKIESGVFGWIKRLICFKTVKQLRQRIARLKIEQ